MTSAALARNLRDPLISPLAIATDVERWHDRVGEVDSTVIVQSVVRLTENLKVRPHIVRAIPIDMGSL
jgi:hypothetical protein